MVIDLHRHADFFSAFLLGRYALLAVIGLGGMALRRQRGLMTTVLGATVAGSTLFYVASNVLSWVGETAYAQTPAGLWQALTVGTPGFPPSYVFFRNGLVSDLLYSMVFVACVRLAQRPENAGAADRVLADAR